MAAAPWEGLGFEELVGVWDFKRLGLGFIWEFPTIRGTVFWGPYNKDPTIQGTILGSPIFGNSHLAVQLEALGSVFSFGVAVGSVWTLR